MNRIINKNAVFCLPFWFLTSLVILFSCGESKKDSGRGGIPAEVIKNPASADKGSNPGLLPTMVFEKDEHDFGKLLQGETVTFGFKFKNTGGSDLIIASVSTSCGCTVTDYPKEAIPPLKQGVVMVTFKTEGRRGFQHKTVTVMANTQPNTKVLKVKAEIRTPDNEN